MGVELAMYCAIGWTDVAIERGSRPVGAGCDAQVLMTYRKSGWFANPQMMHLMFVHSCSMAG